MVGTIGGEKAKGYDVEGETEARDDEEVECLAKSIICIEEIG